MPRSVRTSADCGTGWAAASSVMHVPKCVPGRNPIVFPTYSILPDDWTIGLADIVQSTKAIAEKRYKAVNMAGAAVIAAVTNALGEREFPFVFGGDGASFAVAKEDVEAARTALASTATWVK